MSKIPTVITLNTRALLWIQYLASEHRQSSQVYIEQVLLRHLETIPEVDLSQSPYSQPKGASNGK